MLPVELNEYGNYMLMSQHIPILVNEVIAALQAEASGASRLIDGTVGGGGHSLALLEAGIESVLACDRDASAIETARQRLAAYGDRVHFFQGSYIDMQDAASGLGWGAVDAILPTWGFRPISLMIRLGVSRFVSTPRWICVLTGTAAGRNRGRSGKPPRR